MKEIKDIKIEWQKHNRNYGLNDVAELVNEIASLYSGVSDAELRNETLPKDGISEEDRLIGYVDYISELISYIGLLGKELDAVVPLAHVHGWRSTRHEEGKEARAKLDELAKALLLPPLKAAIKELLNNKP